MCCVAFEANGELIEGPQDTYVLVKNSTYFNCSTTIRQELIHWYHFRVGENSTNYVYYKGEINMKYVSRYTVESNPANGVCNLRIASVEPHDAGLYVCQDDGGLGMSASAQLIVLGNTYFYFKFCLIHYRPGDRRHSIGSSISTKVCVYM